MKRSGQVRGWARDGKYWARDDDGLGHGWPRVGTGLTRCKDTVGEKPRSRLVKKNKARLVGGWARVGDKMDKCC